MRDKFFMEIKYRKLGKTGKNVSICGFGAYRIDQNYSPHFETLKYTLKKGINLIDTSTNYGDGGSEELIGNVITELNGKEISRNDLVIVSKAGYMQGKTLELAKQKEVSQIAYEEIIKCSDQMWHCIHPDFLLDEITNSLDRLNTGYIDIYLLHNPEYFLEYSEEKDSVKKQKEFYRRIENAFRFLESQVDEGRIQFYGVSSNTFGISFDAEKFVSLEKLYEIAESIKPDNHFAVVEMPLNLLEKGALRIRNQLENSLSVLQFAKEKNLGVLINRPLNAIQNKVLYRLADYELKDERGEKELFEILTTIEAIENKFKDNYSELFPEEQKKELINYFSLTGFLKENYNKFENIAHFRDAKSNYFIPRINIALNAVYQKNPKNEAISAELNEYVVYLNMVWDIIDSLYANQANQANSSLHSLLNNYLDEEFYNIPLSQKAILFINSLREVSSVLVGMRSIKYVNDVLEAMNQNYIIDTYKFWNE